MNSSRTADTNSIRVGRISFTVSNLQEATTKVIQAANSQDSIPIRLSNAYCVAVASSDQDYAKEMQKSGLIFADGTPVVWFMKAARRGHSMKPGRVRGPSLFLNVLDSGRDAGLRHFFLGSSVSTLATMTDNVLSRFPGVKIAGKHSPPFGPLNDEFYNTSLREIQRSDTNIVWVSLGTPKQDYAASKLAEAANLPCVAVGAAFDFTAGNVSPAPKWVQNSGFEWLHRLASEPRRLWKRYLFGNARFIYSAIFESKRQN